MRNSGVSRGADSSISKSLLLVGNFQRLLILPNWMGVKRSHQHVRHAMNTSGSRTSLIPTHIGCAAVHRQAIYPSQSRTSSEVVHRVALRFCRKLETNHYAAVENRVNACRLCCGLSNFPYLFRCRIDLLLLEQTSIRNY